MAPGCCGVARCYEEDFNAPRGDCHVFQTPPRHNASSIGAGRFGPSSRGRVRRKYVRKQKIRLIDRKGRRRLLRFAGSEGPARMGLEVCAGLNDRMALDDCMMLNDRAPDLNREARMPCLACGSFGPFMAFDVSRSRSDPSGARCGGQNISPCALKPCFSMSCRAL